MQEEIKEEAIIVKINNGYCDILLKENDNCEECSAKLFCKPKDEDTKSLTIKNDNNFKVGDKIHITILGSTLLKASFQLYLYPLIILIASLTIGIQLLGNQQYSELYSFLIAITAVAVYYAIFFIFSKYHRDKDPQIFVSKA